MFLIEKTSFDIQANGKIDGFQLQNDLSRWFYHDVLPDIEVLLIRYDRKDEVIQIPKLEIEINGLTPKNLLEEAKQAILNQIEQVLGNWKPNSKNDNTIQVLDNEIFISQKTLADNYFSLWLHFLEHGTIPSSAIQIDDAKMQAAVAETLATNSNAEGKLRYLLSQKSHVLQRLVLQHDDTFLSLILGILAQQDLKILAAWRKTMEQKITQAIKSPSNDILFLQVLEKINITYSKSAFWEQVFKYFIENNNKKEQAVTYFFLPLEIALQKAAKAQKSNQTNIDVALHFFTQVIEKQWFKSNFLQKNLLEKEITKRQKEAINRVGEQAAEKAVVKDKRSKKEAKNQVMEEQKESLLSKISPQVSLEEGAHFYIKNAGIVIAHAFLPSFYENIGLVDEKKQFKDEIAQHKAIQWIAYLATSEEKLPEYRLLLPKILCGLSLDIPLERDLTFSESDKEEAKSLLNAIIEHWAILGKSSIEALQNAFFQRDGKLSHNEKGWLLQVEQRSEDILLTRLPWGIGMIKLPFMKEMLYVEWT